MKSFAGDGGVATSAGLATPRGVAAGADGSIYFADSDNHRIRSVNGAGTISTVAGNGAQGFSGDTGPANLGMLDTPHAVAISSGTTWIARHQQPACPRDSEYEYQHRSRPRKFWSRGSRSLRYITGRHRERQLNGHPVKWSLESDRLCYLSGCNYSASPPPLELLLCKVMLRPSALPGLQRERISSRQNTRAMHSTRSLPVASLSLR